MFKKNSPIIFLIITVVGGIWYSVSGDIWLLVNVSSVWPREDFGLLNIQYIIN